MQNFLICQCLLVLAGVNFPLCCIHKSQYLLFRYISILVELTRLEGTRHGHLIASQMLDVAIRVKAIRAFAVAQMATLLDNAHLLTGNTQRNGICEVLYAAAWICGEFSEYVDIQAERSLSHTDDYFPFLKQSGGKGRPTCRKTFMSVS